VVTPRLSVAFHVVEPMASIPSYEVEALAGLIGLENQGCGQAPHLVVGGTVRPSYRVVFGRWVTVRVITI
jgi:hypothetical protein